VERLSALNQSTPSIGTVPVFRVGGVPIRLHFTFVLLVAFLIVSDLGQESSGTFPLYLMGLLASVLVHELAHAGLASRLRVRTLEIVMFPIGGLARLERRLRPSEELWITLAGPAANLAIAGALFGYLLRALAQQGPEAYVAGTMQRDFLMLDPNADLAEMIPLLTRARRCALVMDGPQLIGMLTIDNLSEFLVLRRFGMEPAI